MISRPSTAWDVEVFYRGSEKFKYAPSIKQSLQVYRANNKGTARARDAFRNLVLPHSQLERKATLLYLLEFGQLARKLTFGKSRFGSIFTASQGRHSVWTTFSLSLSTRSCPESAFLRLCFGASKTSLGAATSLQRRFWRLRRLVPQTFCRFKERSCSQFLCWCIAVKPGCGSNASWRFLYSKITLVTIKNS